MFGLACPHRAQEEASRNAIVRRPESMAMRPGLTLEFKEYRRSCRRLGDGESWYPTQAKIRLEWGTQLSLPIQTLCDAVWFQFRVQYDCLLTRCIRYQIHYNRRSL